MTVLSPRGVRLAVYRYEAVCEVIRQTGDWYEADILDALTARRPSESVIIDAGAHIGNHSVYWLENVAPRALYAFEPMPDNYSLLRSNLRRYPNARAIPLALSDVPGPLLMQRDEVNRGRSRVSPAGDVPVHAVRVDDLGIVDVSLIKLDVEGWHGHVLLGARKTLARSHPALLVEDGEGVVEGTLAALGLHGYERVAQYPGDNDLWEWT